MNTDSECVSNMGYIRMFNDRIGTDAGVLFEKTVVEHCINLA